MASLIPLYEGLGERHRSLLAIVYSRQSSPRQVQENVGSGLVQQSQVELLKTLGFPENRILVLSDAGITGTTAEIRPAVQEARRLIGAGQVGVLAFTESSRANRNDLEFMQMLQLCELHEVLILQDGQLLDPNRSDHRMLLGVRAVIDVFENRLRTHRMTRAKLALIKEGRWMARPPRGYVALNAKMHEVAMHPDPAVQASIRTAFTVLEEEGTVRRTLRRLRREGVRLPNHPPSGSPVTWVEVTAARLFAIFKNPFYAGFLPWGQTKSSPKYGRSPDGRFRSRRMPPETWLLVPDHHPAFVSPERFWRIQQRLRENRIVARQPARGGAALLQGLIRCAHCGHAMVTARGAYECQTGRELGEPQCNYVHAALVDHVVVEEVLTAIQSLGEEAVEHAIGQLFESLQREQAALQAEIADAQRRTRRLKAHYDALDDTYPNVKAELIQEWEAALARLKELQARLARESAAAPTPLTPEELQQLRALRTDLRLVWDAPSTTNEDRKMVIRLLGQQVSYRRSDDGVFGQLEVTWGDGTISTHRVVRGGQFRRLEDSLLASGADPDEIAAIANELGVSSRSPQREFRFDASLIRRRLWSRYGAEHEARARAALLELDDQRLSQARMAQVLNEQDIIARGWRKHTRKTVGRILRAHGRRQVDRMVVVKARVAELDDQGLTLAEIAERLRALGLRGRGGRPYSRHAVNGLLKLMGRRGGSSVSAS